jgi:prepilin-type N-terminal cleavage/methylation domain-containing protein
MNKTTTGFTIVELLIVIVVIAILAAISIVSFTGIQDRAEASKTASAINAYKKGLEMYKAAKGEYPVTGAMCLGEDYDAFTGQTVPSCRYSTSPIAMAGNAAGRNKLKEFMGDNLPMPSKKFVLNGTGEWVGGHFYGSTYNYKLDGKPVVTIEYATSESKCPVGPVYAAGAPNFSSPAVEQSQAMTSGGSRCILLLADE